MARPGEDTVPSFSKPAKEAAHSLSKLARETAPSFGAWLVTCNPKLSEAAPLRLDGTTRVIRWPIGPGVRAGLMEHGQPILFWIVGREGRAPTPGLWGAGIVTGRVSEEDGVVPVDIEVWPAPVPRRVLRADPLLANLEVLRQPRRANPHLVTAEELAALGAHVDLAAPRITIGPAGAAFGDTEPLAEHERAAVRFVAAQYRQRGWRVREVGQERRGWDLECTSPWNEIEYVEVKGVTGVAPAVLLTREEARIARDLPAWRLAVVTRVLAEPELWMVKGPTVLRRADPLVYGVDLSPH
jgi:hypothetical protein